MQNCVYCKKDFKNLTLHYKRNKKCQNDKETLCMYCLNKTIHRNYFNDDLVCMKCEKANSKYKCITKTTAKTDYCLSEKDLSTLDYDSVPNPKYKSAPEMILYLESDVKEKANIKYNGKLNEELEKRRNKKIQKQELLENAQDERTKELFLGLYDKGIMFRSDSKLCQGYIHNTLDKRWTLESVIDMCCEMHWLFNYTNYQNELDKAIREEKRYSYYYDFEEIDSIVRGKIFRKYSRPKIWPWLKNPETKKDIDSQIKLQAKLNGQKLYLNQSSISMQELLENRKN